MEKNILKFQSLSYIELLFNNSNIIIKRKNIQYYFQRKLKNNIKNQLNYYINKNF